MSTQENLKEAFAGESQANRKYLAFAKQAEKEGYQTIARLFNATAEAETIHAHSHLQALGAIKSTAENLLTAKQGETYEFEQMYPPFIEEAARVNNQKALRSFKYAAEAEKIHAAHYAKAAEELEKNVEHDYYLCPICGNIELDQVPDKCKICGAAGTKFVKY